MRKPTVLVTGGTKRLGKAIADRLERGGWRVVRSSHRAEAGADVMADLSDESAWDALYAAAELALEDSLDAIVNNAAIFTGDEKAMERINLRAPLRLTELMSENGGGAVVNIIDSRVLRAGFKPSNCYERTKRALLEATIAGGRDEARPSRVRVNGVAPGPVLAPEGVREKAGDCPLGRPTPEDVAEAVAYLLSARATSGCIIPVDGGQSTL